MSALKAKSCTLLPALTYGLHDNGGSGGRGARVGGGKDCEVGWGWKGGGGGGVGCW